MAACSHHLADCRRRPSPPRTSPGPHPWMPCLHAPGPPVPTVPIGRLGVSPLMLMPESYITV
jgi:hypothetical protein